MSRLFLVSSDGDSEKYGRVFPVQSAVEPQSYKQLGKLGVCNSEMYATQNLLNYPLPKST